MGVTRRTAIARLLREDGQGPVRIGPHLRKHWCAILGLNQLALSLISFTRCAVKPRLGPHQPHCSWVVRVRKRPIHQHPLSASPLNDANLMAGLHAGDRVDTKPTEQGGGVESL
jgi:hypothetical protein